MAVIVWQDPPKQASGKGSSEDPSWEELRKELREHPDTWGLVEEDAPSKRLSVYRNHLKRADGFKVRQSAKGWADEGDLNAWQKFDIYVMYAGVEDVGSSS